MLRSVIATALALCLAAALGCGKKGASSTPASKAAGGSTTASAGTAPVDDSKVNIETKIALPPSLYESAEIGKSVKPDGSIDQKSEDFNHSDHLFISVKASQVPTALAANLTIKNPEKKPVVDTRAEFTAATKHAVFSVADLSKWKPGSYDIEVEMEGDVVYKHGMRIIGKGGTAGARTKK